MTELYALAFQLCVSALIPNPHTIMNLPEHQQKYILEAVISTCKEETKFEQLMMCVEKKFVDCEVM